LKYETNLVLYHVPWANGAARQAFADKSRRINSSAGLNK